MTKHMLAIFSLLVVLLASASGLKMGRFPLLMPNVRPHRDELYLCTPVKVDFTTSYYITAFEPNATSNTAHHMLLYGCGEPGSEESVWNCGEMASGDDDQEERGSPCGQGSASQIVYAWARDAPKLNLPPEVGFKVGADSPIKYLVLQVHYAHTHQFKDGSTDDSGVIIEYTTKPMPKQAGVLLMGTAGAIPAHHTEHMDTVCEIKEAKTIFPFAYRTHTHSLGKVVSGYRVRPDANGVDEWTLLGKRDPLTPQMFYPTLSTDPIRQGDRVASRCTMESHRSRMTFVGGTNEDEMCNFYLMYYVEKGEPLEQKYCFSAGPPMFHWTDDEALNNIPEVEANTL